MERVRSFTFLYKTSSQVFYVLRSGRISFITFQSCILSMLSLDLIGSLYLLDCRCKSFSFTAMTLLPVALPIIQDCIIPPISSLTLFATSRLVRLLRGQVMNIVELFNLNRVSLCHTWVTGSCALRRVHPTNQGALVPNDVHKAEKNRDSYYGKILTSNQKITPPPHDNLFLGITLS
ncbi:hypothetical protein BT96DRAFT_306229 [Gymnopus androsaceus JB14]|uniref:Uncharacterized protein n=1 Tax=Gymnopus androsaceus JB14 TaxID=1447944 RepID=A0A6A4I5J9_9AGAR|nr:hypothetical protein BT96DRAFT_306229 [Gymnopus androsaceus JB14]